MNYFISLNWSVYASPLSPDRAYTAEILQVYFDYGRHGSDRQQLC